MKKRTISIVLAVLMILSLLPTAALAADGSQTSAPVLRMHMMQENNGSWTEDFVSGGGDWYIHDSWVAEFYLHHSTYGIHAFV